MNGRFLAGIFFAGLLMSLVYIQAEAVSAQTVSSSSAVKVRAQVGEFNLSVSGYISPHASLSLIANDAVLRGTVADGKGNFEFENIVISRGFYQFCISAVDWKRLGESYSCFNIEPASSDVAIKGIFLPPTIGVNRFELVEGSDASVLGFSMPQASVTVKSGAKKYEVKADQEGKYEYTFQSVKQGSYLLVADAVYEGKKSEPPAKGVTFKVIPYVDYAVQNLMDLAKRGLTPDALFLYALMLGSVGLLIFARYPEETLIFFRLRPKRLHHWWLVGY